MEHYQPYKGRLYTAFVFNNLQASHADHIPLLDCSSQIGVLTTFTLLEH